MTDDPNVIKIAEDSEIARLLAQVDGTPLRLQAKGVVYRVTREPEPNPRFDADKMRAAIAAAAGTLTPEEGEAFKAYVYRAREEGSRPATRP